MSYKGITKEDLETMRKNGLSLAEEQQLYWEKEDYLEVDKDKEIERLKSNEKTLADLLDKEQKKNKKAIEYIETLQISEYDSQGYWIRHNDNEDLSIENTKDKLLNILKGGGV